MGTSGLRWRGAMVAVGAAGGAGLGSFLTATAAPQPSPGVVTFGAVTGALLLGGMLSLALLGPLDAVLEALSSALLSYRENDFSVRVSRVPSLQRLIESFNTLGDQLRLERNTLYQKELMLETVLEAATFAIVLCDEAGTVLFANTTARALFRNGRPLAGMPFRTLLDALFPEGMPDTSHRGGALVTVEREGAPEVFHTSTRYFDLNAERHTLYFFKSITREVARQEVEVWKRTMRIVSHEVDNSFAPVTSMLGAMRTILDKPEHAHRLKDALGIVEERTTHLRTFLDGYARLARLPSPRPGLVPWSRFVDALRPLYPFQPPTSLPADAGWFDEAQLQQVVINLLKNAVEAGGPVDAIELRVSRRNDGDVTLSVLDRGAGLSDEALTKAMQLFFTTKKGGSGLGLALAREIIEAHGGRLLLDRREGGGTAAHCILPPPPPSLRG